MFKHVKVVYKRCQGIFPLTNLNTRWRWMVSLTYQLLYPQPKRPGCSLDRTLGGSQSVWKHSQWEIYAPAVNHTLWSSHYTDWAAPAFIIRKLNQRKSLFVEMIQLPIPTHDFIFFLDAAKRFIVLHSVSRGLAFLKLLECQ